MKNGKKEMKKHVILFRGSLAEEGELGALNSYFDVYQNRAKIPRNSTVVGRYSVLPYYTELEEELKFNSSKLINSWHEHRYVADLGSYIEDLQDLTPQTWLDLSETPRNGGPFVLKGETNSKKHQWHTHMFAQTWEDAMHVQMRLTEDSLIGQQRIYVRKYVPLMRLGTTLTGLPITKEFRFFVLYNTVVGSGFYWDAFQHDIVEQGGKIPTVDEVPQTFIDEVIDRVRNKVPFYVFDCAQDENGRWWVIELNDGQMSGLSGIDSMTLYSNMKKVLQHVG